MESRALARWAAFARSSRVARRAAARWASRRVSGAFRAWRLATVSRLARRASRSLARARVSDAERARVARFAAAAFYERRSRDFFSRVVLRWRALVAESRRRSERLGDEMRAVLDRRSARRVLDKWNELAFVKSSRRAQTEMAARVGRDARLAKALLGWRGAAAEALAARGTPLPGMKSRRKTFSREKENAAPPRVVAGAASWDWNASVLQNVSASVSPLFPTSAASRTSGDAWLASISPVPLPSLDLDLGAVASPPSRATSSASAPPSRSPHVGGSPRAPRTPVDALRGKKAELSSIDAQRGRAAVGSPARGALDAAYRDVLAECARLEASVEAMGTGAPSRLGAAARDAPGASSDRTSASSMDARLVDAGSRAAGLLERAEAMRREMREVSQASRAEAAEAASAPPAETDWGAGLGLGRKNA